MYRCFLLLLLLYLCRPSMREGLFVFSSSCLLTTEQNKNIFQGEPAIAWSPLLRLFPLFLLPYSFFAVRVFVLSSLRHIIATRDDVESLLAAHVASPVSIDSNTTGHSCTSSSTCIAFWKSLFTHFRRVEKRRPSQPFLC